MPPYLDELNQAVASAIESNRPIEEAYFAKYGVYCNIDWKEIPLVVPGHMIGAAINYNGGSDGIGVDGVFQYIEENGKTVWLRSICFGPSQDPLRNYDWTLKRD